MTKLADLATVIRSKNAGPYELTFDLLFAKQEDAKEVYNKLSNEKIANLYQIKEEQVISIIHFKPAAAVKITIVRPRASGDLGETDVYGAQQHAPLLDLEI